MADVERDDDTEGPPTGIRRWHHGKLIILWSWGVVLMGVSLYIVVALPRERVLLGTALLLVSAVVPIVLSVVTWRWLTGREEADS